eukprot:CAMPEP_0172720770 /NCGR_PEP_ID=MMETSP1074-20121228/77614_1 /TAXON_ID=2916 /ORGANISM="Ceratium fusus, Strain PA161109" /LENGTH=53 /DNA_ID=CAMNT_0013546347 /DNA_START=1281 /DNA_END=1442 /DNA_ORIENTATION=+
MATGDNAATGNRVTVNVSERHSNAPMPGSVASTLPEAVAKSMPSAPSVTGRPA